MNKATYVISGLGMIQNEFSFIEGIRPLPNSLTSDSYTIEDIAEANCERLRATLPANSQLVILGFSMGGMILSVMATKFRNLLPAMTHFIFINSSPNLPSNPVLNMNLIKSWKRKESESNQEYFERTLESFFSDTFLRLQKATYQNYASLRAHDDNHQSADELKSQVTAILNWNGQSYFELLNPNECEFIFCSEDKVITEPHVSDTRRLVKNAVIHILPDVGHMLTVEKPKLLKEIVAGRLQ